MQNGEPLYVKTISDFFFFFHSSLRCGENNIGKFKITFFNLFGKFIGTSLKKELLKCKASKGK